MRPLGIPASLSLPHDSNPSCCQTETSPETVGANSPADLSLPSGLGHRIIHCCFRRVRLGGVVCYAAVSKQKCPVNIKALHIAGPKCLLFGERMRLSPGSKKNGRKENKKKGIFDARCGKPPSASFLSECFSLKSLLYWKAFKTLRELTLNVSFHCQVRQPAQTPGTAESL